MYTCVFICNNEAFRYIIREINVKLFKIRDRFIIAVIIFYLQNCPNCLITHNKHEHTKTLLGHLLIQINADFRVTQHCI